MWSEVCVRVCVCHYPHPQEDQPRPASRCYFIFRFGSFSVDSVSSKTLKALWLCGLFPLQREGHRTAAGVTQSGATVFGHVRMQWKPPAGAVISSVALTKHARPHLVASNHSDTIAFWGSQTFFFVSLKCSY